MAMFTYQVLYWGWEKLRLDELREEKNGMVSVPRLSRQSLTTL